MVTTLALPDKTFGTSTGPVGIQTASYKWVRTGNLTLRFLSHKNVIQKGQIISNETIHGISHNYRWARLLFWWGKEVGQGTN